MLVIAFLGLGGMVGLEVLERGRVVAALVGLVVGEGAAFALLAAARPRPAAAGALGGGFALAVAVAAGAAGGAEEEEGGALAGRPRELLGGAAAEEVVAAGTAAAVFVTASPLCSMRELRRMVCLGLRVVCSGWDGNDG